MSLYRSVSIFFLNNTSVLKDDRVKNEDFWVRIYHILTHITHKNTLKCIIHRLLVFSTIAFIFSVNFSNFSFSLMHPISFSSSQTTSSPELMRSNLAEGSVPRQVNTKGVKNRSLMMIGSAE